MRIALAVAAGLLWVGAAYAQPAQNAGNAGAIAPSVAEPTVGQTPTTPVSPTDSTQTIANQTADANHQIICHTMPNTGSRLARHANRVCKTREQWEIEQHDNQQVLQRMGTTQSPGNN
jgi:hypothetical protein